MKLKKTESLFSKDFQQSMAMDELTSTEVRVYTSLAAFLGYETPTCFSMSKVEKVSGLSLVTAHKAVQKLTAKGWLTVEREYDRAPTTITVKYKREV